MEAEISKNITMDNGESSIKVVSWIIKDMVSEYNTKLRLFIEVILTMEAVMDKEGWQTRQATTTTETSKTDSQKGKACIRKETLLQSAETTKQKSNLKGPAWNSCQN